MSISTRQFEILSEMDIPLWQYKNKRLNSHNSKSTVHSSVEQIDITIDELAKHQFFKDILNIFNVSIGEIQPHQSTVNLGLFNWRFNDKSEVTLEHNTLTTPSIEQIIKTPKLKQQIWQLLSQAL